MVVAIAIGAPGNALEAPAVHLSHEAGVLALMGKILGGDFLAEEGGLEHPP